MRKIIAALTVLLAVVGFTATLPVQAQAAAQTRKPCTQQEQSKTRLNDSQCVKYIQQMLNTHKLVSPALAVDGEFGPKTKAAVIAWQKKQKQTNAKMLVDGIVGLQTWGTLCAHKTKYPQLAKDAGCDKQKKPIACNKRTFSVRTNTNDTCVGYIQSMLKLAGNTELGANDYFESETKIAVLAWQNKKKIKQDGIVGTQTWGTLCAHKTPPPEATQDLYTAYARLAGCKR